MQLLLHLLSAAAGASHVAVGGHGAAEAEIAGAAALLLESHDMLQSHTQGAGEELVDLRYVSSDQAGLQGMKQTKLAMPCSRWGAVF